jgi:hypothetical protein
MRPPWLTTRRLMVVVAAVGAVLGVSRWVAWVIRCERTAALYGKLEANYDTSASAGTAFELTDPRGESDRQFNAHNKRWAIYSRRLRSKWERAALYPWLPVAPDPPPPNVSLLR